MDIRQCLPHNLNLPINAKSMGSIGKPSTGIPDYVLTDYSGLFNGTDAYGTIPDSTDFPKDATDAFTIETIITPTNTAGTGSGYLYSQSTSDSNATDTLALLLYDESHVSLAGKVAFTKRDDAVYLPFLTSTSAITFNVSNHIAITFDGVDLYTLWVNGASAGTDTQSIGNLTIASKVYFGCTSWDQTSFFKGNQAMMAVHTTNIYTAPFTPPVNVSDVTNDTDTIVLLDYTDLENGATPATIVNTANGASHIITNVGQNISGVVV